MVSFISKGTPCRYPQLTADEGITSLDWKSLSLAVSQRPPRLTVSQASCVQRSVEHFDTCILTFEAVSILSRTVLWWADTEVPVCK